MRTILKSNRAVKFAGERPEAAAGGSTLPAAHLCATPANQCWTTQAGAAVIGCWCLASHVPPGVVVRVNFESEFAQNGGVWPLYLATSRPR